MDKISRDKALKIAQEFLIRDGLDTVYRLEDGEAGDQGAAFWIVRFPKRKPSRPNYGEVQVSRRTGKAKVIKLR